jgi:hypothetical protein
LILSRVAVGHNPVQIHHFLVKTRLGTARSREEYLLQLVYISSARAPLSDAAFHELLAQARRNNRALGVTGLLLAGDRRFLQALEGPEANVDAIFARIRADERHRAIVELVRREVEAREFGSWDMAFERSRGGGRLSQEVDKLTATIADPNLRAQFTGFAALHGRAA